jgi:chromosome segregation ATPase
MFQADEHVHLFTAEAMREWLARVGLGEVLIRPSLFPYDMLVVAGRRRFPLRAAIDADREPGWRMPAAIRGLLHAARAVREGHDARAALAAGSATRLGHVEALEARLAASEADRAARLERIAELGGVIGDLEETRRRETGALAREIHALAADGAARLRQVEELTRLLRDSEGDRAARLAQIETLGELLRGAEADRAARLEVIRALEARIEAIQGTLIWRVYERMQTARGRRAG